MGRFSGYLICSDYDGTFAVKGEPVRENVDAVRYFVDNGGRFTVATGRMTEFIREKGMEKIINAPACLCNGSMIYDFSQEKPLRQRYLDFTVENFLEVVRPVAELLHSFYVFADGDSGSTYYEDLRRISREHLRTKALKLLCKFETEEKANLFQSFASSQDLLKMSHISKSWKVGVEFNPADATKGHAIDYIKSYLGDIHTTIGVGDFENDVTLLKHADLGAAPADAHDCVKRAARWILLPCGDGSIKDLIERLDEKENSGH